MPCEKTKTWDLRSFIKAFKQSGCQMKMGNCLWQKQSK